MRLVKRIYLKISELLTVSHFEDDFMKAIDKLSIAASCGPDGWSASLVKGLKIPLSRYLTKIYRLSMKDGKFPKKLKLA